eukprot:ANDGO_05193.mRNA.1 ABC transporter G family member 15
MSMESELSVSTADLPGTERAAAEAVQATSKFSLSEFPTTLQFENLSFSVEVNSVDQDGRGVKARRYILRNLSGAVKPGGVLCVMGPTGSGKTTFLDALAGRIGSGLLEGKILINGVERSDLGDRFARIAGFVPQFEALQSTLTVMETMIYAAELNLPSTMSHQEKIERCSEILDQMGLHSVRNTLVGGPFLAGISGGQRKRLGIAVELVTAKPLLFLDEPTTGLDSSSSLFVMELIINLAKKYGCTIVCTIHQPQFQLFELFDRLLLLSRGKMVYMGKASEGPRFFEECGVPVPQYTNPADHFLDVLNTDFSSSSSATSAEAAEAAVVAEQTIDTMVLKFAGFLQQSETSKSDTSATGNDRPSAVPGSDFNTSAAHQLWWLLKRSFLDTARNPLTFWASFVLYVSLSLFMGVLYLNMSTNVDQVQNRIAILFFIAAFCSFMKISSLPGFVEQRDVFVRERLNGYYRVWVYALATSITAIPFIVLTALAAASCVYFLADLRSGAGHFFYFAAMFAAVLYAAEGLVISFSALIPMYIVGLALSSGMFGIMMLMCGFFIPKISLPDGWIWAYYLSMFTYAFRSMLYNEFNDVDYTLPNGAGKIAGQEFLVRFKADSNTLGMDIGIVIAMAVFYRILFYVFLKYRQTGKR